jgi:sRNA-binding carbon storage regulator CsrA
MGMLVLNRKRGEAIRLHLPTLKCNDVLSQQQTAQAIAEQVLTSSEVLLTIEAFLTARAMALAPALDVETGTIVQVNPLLSFRNKLAALLLPAIQAGLPVSVEGGGSAEISVLRIDGQNVDLGIDAPRTINVARTELLARTLPTVADPPPTPPAMARASSRSPLPRLAAMPTNASPGSTAEPRHAHIPRLRGQGERRSMRPRTS